MWGNYDVWLHRNNPSYITVCVWGGGGGHIGGIMMSDYTETILLYYWVCVWGGGGHIGGIMMSDYTETIIVTL